MLLLLLTILIYSLACWFWGNTFLSALTHSSSKEDRLFIHAVLGLILLTSLVGIFSLFGYSSFLFEGLLPLSAALFFIRKKTRADLSEQWRSLQIGGLSLTAFLIISVLLLLIIGADSIYHPDTLAYHAPVVNWIKQYKAVPGIVHLNNRYGIQSSWFISTALSSPRWILGNASGYNVANLTLLTWLVLFITSKVTGVKSAFPKIDIPAVAWLLLLLMGWLCFTQIRLTAISASPDFPAAIFSLGGIYFLCKESDSDVNHWLIAFLFLVMAISIKLSCIPFIIPAILCKVQWWKKKGFLSTALMGISGLFIYLPVAIRSIIASGYPFYPSTALRMSFLDWTYDASLASIQEKYITAYARSSGITYDQVASTLALPFSKWFPSWWSNLYGADKMALLLGLFSLVIVLLNIKKTFTWSAAWKITLLTAVLGIIFWFWRAPDPRFGWPYLLLLPVVALRLLPAKLIGILTAVRTAIAMNTFTFALLGFTAYKLTQWKNLTELVAPSPIKTFDIRRENCKGVWIAFPKEEMPCSGTDQPCSIAPCEDIQPRGPKLEDGFRPVK